MKYKALEITHLTTRQLADRWEMAPGTLANWRVTGKGPRYEKKGKAVRYPLKEVVEFEEAYSRANTA